MISVPSFDTNFNISDHVRQRGNADLECGWNKSHSSNIPPHKQTDKGLSSHHRRVRSSNLPGDESRSVPLLSSQNMLHVLVVQTNM